MAIENIHVHLARGEPKMKAVFDAARETITPRLLAMLAILAVFAPSFLMVGVSRALFVPLSLAVGLAMLASYSLSNTLVPVLAVWLLREQAHKEADDSFFHRLQQRYARMMTGLMRLRWPLLACYALITVASIFFIGRQLGLDIFPPVESGMMQLRLRAPTGTRVERTEVMALTALKAIRDEAGPGNVEITLGYVGTQPASYPINTIYLWTNGPQEAVLNVKLRSGSGVKLSDFEERMRQKLPALLPGASFSFEAGDIVTQIMNFGAPTPIEVAMSGPNLAANRAFADKVLAEMKKVSTLRDLQFGQPSTSALTESAPGNWA